MDALRIEAFAFWVRNERRIGRNSVQPLLFVDIVAEWVIKLTVDRVRHIVFCFCTWMIVAFLPLMTKPLMIFAYHLVAPFFSKTKVPLRIFLAFKLRS